MVEKYLPQFVINCLRIIPFLAVVLAFLLVPNHALAQTVFSENFNNCSEGGAITDCNANIVPWSGSGGGTTSDGYCYSTARYVYDLLNYSWHNVCFSFDTRPVPNGPGEFALELFLNRKEPSSTDQHRYQ